MNFNEYSFYYNYKGLIKAIILNNYKSKEEKERVLNNLLRITESEFVYQEMYAYVQRMQEIQFKYSGYHLDLDNYTANSNPSISKKQLDNDMKNYRNNPIFQTSLKNKTPSTINLVPPPSPLTRTDPTMAPFKPTKELKREDDNLIVNGRKIYIFTEPEDQLELSEQEEELFEEEYPESISEYDMLSDALP